MFPPMVPPMLPRRCPFDLCEVVDWSGTRHLVRFRELDGSWRFRSLKPQACKVEFHLRYDFASRVLEGLIGPVFNHIATTFIDAFVKRADNLHKEAP